MIVKTIGAYIALYCFVFFILFNDEALTKAAKASCQHAQEPIKEYACELVALDEAIEDMPTKEEMEALEKEIQREIEKHKALERKIWRMRAQCRAKEVKITVRFTQPQRGARTNIVTGAELCNMNTRWR